MHVHLTCWRHDGRGVAIRRTHIVVGVSSVGASGVIAQLIHARKAKLVVVVIEASRLTHASIAKAVKDINVARRQAKVRLFGRKLEHRVCQRRDEVMNLAEEERQEAVMTILQHRKDVQDLMKLLTRPDLEGNPPGWLVGEHVGKGASDAEKLLDQGQATKTEVTGEVGNHGKQIVGNIDRVRIRQAGLVAVSACYCQLPHRVLGP